MTDEYYFHKSNIYSETENLILLLDRILRVTVLITSASL